MQLLRVLGEREKEMQKVERGWPERRAKLKLKVLVLAWQRA